MIEDKKTPKPKVQNLILENRERLSVSGVIDVESFNDESVIVDTELGVLVVRGMDLHINKLNILISIFLISIILFAYLILVILILYYTLV